MRAKRWRGGGSGVMGVMRVTTVTAVTGVAGVISGGEGTGEGEDL